MILYGTSKVLDDKIIELNKTKNMLQKSKKERKKKIRPKCLLLVTSRTVRWVRHQS